MERSSSIFNFNKLPKAFILAALMIFVTEILFAYFDVYFYPRPMWGVKIKTKENFTYAYGSRYDVLTFGDSYNTYAVLPKVIYNKTELSCYNFSTYFTQSPFIHYCMLKNYLKRCSKKPKIVIIGYLQPPFGFYFSKNDILSQLPGNSYILRGNYGLFFKEFGLVRLLEAFMPSRKHHQALKRLFFYPFSFKLPDKKLIDSAVREVHFYDGYQLYRFDEVWKDDRVLDRGDLINRPVDPFFLKYLKGFLKLAYDNDIKVMYLIPTESPGRYKDSLERGIVKRYDDMLCLLKEDFPGLVVLNYQSTLSEREFYSDQWHLNRKGTLLLSERLSDSIKDLILSGIK